MILHLPTNLPNFIQMGSLQPSHDVISIFGDGVLKVVDLLPASVLMAVLV